MLEYDETEDYRAKISLIEVGEPVGGGPDGVDNRALKQLADRTGWLKTKIQHVEDSAVSGAVFITNIAPQAAGANVGEKVMSADGFTLESCSSTSPLVIVSVTAITGHTNYRPNIRIGGVLVPLVAKADAPLWTGTLAITLPAADKDGVSIVEATHDDGAISRVAVTTDTAPVLSEAIFTGDYPVGQTELKAGDKFSIKFTSDVNVVGYEIDDTGAFAATSGAFPAGKVINVADVVIANRGVVSTAFGFRIRVKKASGSWSAWYDSKTVGGVDKVNTVKLNNVMPVVTFGTKVYPGAQTALKTADQATVNHTVTNYDTITYTSDELTITAPTVFEAAKKATYKSGTYNVSVENFKIVAKRAANGATVTAETVVNIASVAPVISMTVPAARLRSGGRNGTTVQKHVITVTSTQALAAAPSMNAPEGAWETAAWVANTAKTVWTRALEVHDDNAKGTFVFNTLQAAGLSGLIQSDFTGPSGYTLGGFVFRKLTMAAWPNREAAIGTQVVDVAKLRATNLGKGTTGSLNTAFQANLVNTLDKFTITGPTGVLNPTGNLWYNLDAPNASSNTSGSLSIEVEEVI